MNAYWHSGPFLMAYCTSANVTTIPLLHSSECEHKRRGVGSLCVQCLGCSAHWSICSPLQALRFEQDHSDGVGASIAEKVLSVMGGVLLEASNSQTVIIRQSSMGGESTAPELARDEQSQLGQLLKHIETPFVVSHVTVM